jgi:hypothetical protein
MGWRGQAHAREHRLAGHMAAKCGPRAGKHMLGCRAKRPSQSDLRKDGEMWVGMKKARQWATAGMQNAGVPRVEAETDLKTPG